MYVFKRTLSLASAIVTRRATTHCSELAPFADPAEPAARKGSGSPSVHAALGFQSIQRCRDVSSPASNSAQTRAHRVLARSPRRSHCRCASYEAPARRWGCARTNSSALVHREAGKLAPAFAARNSSTSCDTSCSTPEVFVRLTACRCCGLLLPVQAATGAREAESEEERTWCPSKAPEDPVGDAVVQPVAVRRPRERDAALAESRDVLRCTCNMLRE